MGRDLNILASILPEKQTDLTLTVTKIIICVRIDVYFKSIISQQELIVFSTFNVIWPSEIGTDIMFGFRDIKTKSNDV